MRKRMIPLLAALLALAMSVPAYAAGQPQTVIGSEGGGTTITITDITPREEQEDEAKEKTFTAGSFYPVEIQTAEDNGVRLLVKTFVVPQGTSPEALIEEGLTRRGVEYRVSDILRRELAGDTQSRQMTQTVTTASDSNDKDELLELLASTLEYSEDGFSGTLTLDESSIKTEAAGAQSYAYTLKDVKEYTGLDRNDPYYVPKTAQKSGVTLQLADVEWTPMASAAENSEVPSLFTATATYTGTAWGSKADGYIVTASYSGEVSKVSEGDIVYSIVYEEAEAPVMENVGAAKFNRNLILTLLLVFLIAVFFAASVLWLVPRYKEQRGAREVEKRQSDPYADRPKMDLPDMLDEMDRGMEEDYR